jgi:hypothetical protein
MAIFAYLWAWSVYLKTVAGPSQAGLTDRVGRTGRTNAPGPTPPGPPLPRGPGHTLPPWALAPAPHDAVLSLLPALAALLRACSGPAECMALHNKLACDPIEALDGSGCSCQIQLLTVLPEPVCLPVTGSQCGVTADLILNHFDGECESVSLCVMPLQVQTPASAMAALAYFCAKLLIITRHSSQCQSPLNSAITLKRLLPRFNVRHARHCTQVRPSRSDSVAGPTQDHVCAGLCGTP